MAMIGDTSAGSNRYKVSNLATSKNIYTSLYLTAMSPITGPKLCQSNLTPIFTKREFFTMLFVKFDRP